MQDALKLRFELCTPVHPKGRLSAILNELVTFVHTWHRKHVLDAHQKYCVSFLTQNGGNNTWSKKNRKTIDRTKLHVCPRHDNFTIFEMTTYWTHRSCFQQSMLLTKALHELIEGQLTERTVADTANVAKNTFILGIGAGSQNGFNATRVDFLLSIQKQPVSTLMRRTEHLGRLGSAGYSPPSNLRARQSTCSATLQPPSLS